MRPVTDTMTVKSRVARPTATSADNPGGDEVNDSSDAMGVFMVSDCFTRVVEGDCGGGFESEVMWFILDFLCNFEYLNNKGKHGKIRHSYAVR